MTFRPTALAFALTFFAVPAPFATLPADANVQHALDNRFVVSARAHYENGRMREAAIELKNALRQDPGDASARLLLGRILLEQGDVAGAESELQKAHNIDPTDEAAKLLGEAQLQRGGYADALRTVEGTGATVDLTIDRMAIRGSALSGLNRLDEAEAVYREMLQLDPRRVEGHFGLAQVLASRADYRAAADKLDEIVIGKPDFSPGWMLRGEIALAAGDKQAAFVAFDKAVSLSPDSVPALVARARAHLASGDLQRAESDTRAVADLAPNAPITHYLRAATAFAHGDIDAANSSFTQLQRNFDNFSPAVLLGALIKHQKGDQNQADALLSRYIAMQPDNMDARRALASVRLKSGQPTSAIDILQGVLRDAPKDTASLRQLASAYLALDDYSKAEATFRKITEHGSGNLAREANMALSLLDETKIGSDTALKSPQVRQTLLKAIDRIANTDAKGAEALLNALDSEGATILSLKGNVAAELGKTEEARTLLTQALEIEPELTSAIATFERLDQREGTADRILPRLRSLLEKRPASERLTLAIAQRMGTEGDREAATNFLAERAAKNPKSVAIGRALVAALMVQKRFPEAAEAAWRLASIAPDDPGMQNYAVNVLIDANDPERAVGIAKNLLAMATDSPRAHTLLAESQVKAGNVNAARATLDAARDRWPGDSGIAGSIVRLEAARKNMNGVREATDTLARTDPATATRLRANALAEMGQPVLAVEILEKAFAKNPDQRLAVDLYSHRRRAGRDEAAFAGLGAWVGQHPQDRAALMTYATGLLETGQHERSSTAYEAFLALEPGNPVALNNYAWLRHQAQRPDALDYAQRAYEAASGSPEVADTYGWMLVRYGKLKEGLALLKAAQAAAPDSKPIRYHYAYALSMAGRKDEAKTVLGDVLSTSEAFEERAEAEALMRRLNEG